MPLDENDIVLNTLLERDPTQAFSKIDDEVVMLSQTKGEYYALNTVGSRIWELIHEPVRVKTIVEQLTNEYEIGSEECVQQTIELLNELNNRSLVRIIRND